MSIFKKMAQFRKKRVQNVYWAKHEEKVIAHENVHKQIAGRYAGPIYYIKEHMADGKEYIINGGMDIDLRPHKNPYLTREKMLTIIKSAEAVDRMSSSDIMVRNKARGFLRQAQNEINILERKKNIRFI